MISTQPGTPEPAHQPAPLAGEPTLERTIGWKQMAFYGLGGMLGAGIYGLVGRAAEQMGSAVWLAFLVSMVAALLTGLSYACIGSRYPRAGGAAYVTQRAYGIPLLTYVVGLAVMCSGLSSIATQSHVVAENLQRLVGLESVPLLVLALGFLLLLAAIVFRGIRECMWLNIVCTSIEVGGLVLIIAVGLRYWGSANLLDVPPAPDGSSSIGLLMVMNGAVLTFFSFIGFEDTLNVAEEVKDPHRNLPLGLMIAMAAATIIYMAVAITAVSVVPWRELAAAPGPLAEVMKRAAPWFPQIGFVAITIFAVANTALLNYVMGSRLAYGMARQGLLPGSLARIHSTRHTPHVAVGVLLIIAMALALLGNISQLAAATVILLLIVFTIVNGALVLLKFRPNETQGAFEVPFIVPALGAIVCLALLVNRVASGNWQAPAIAGGLVLAILALYAFTRPEHVVEEPGGVPAE